MRSVAASRVSTPETSLLSQFQVMEHLIDRPTALRVQKMIKKRKLKEEEATRAEFLKKQLAE